MNQLTDEEFINFLKSYEDGFYTDRFGIKHKFYDSPGARKSLLESGFTIIIPNATSKGGADGTAAYYFPSTIPI